MTIIDYQDKFHHPANNFGIPAMWDPYSEHEFGNHFVRIFDQISDHHVVAIRELPVPGSGIADLVVVSRKPKISVQSFEFKLRDWRKGLMQAHRYKYFSNSSILVLPANMLRSAEKSVDLFRQLNVGLWAFDMATGSILKKFTPLNKNAPDVRRTEYVLSKAAGND